jgi:hypothetical protein
MMDNLKILISYKDKSIKNNTFTKIKNNMKIKLLLIATSLISLISNAQVNSKIDELQTSYNESETVFEGYSLNKKTSFLTPNKTIFTLLSFKVTKIIKGVMPSDSIIKIEIDGGSITDPETGMIMDNSYSAHGNGFIASSNAIYYLNQKNERNNNRLKRMIDISNSNKIVFNDIESYNTQPYTKLIDLYSDLSKLSGKQLIIEKKSLNVKESELNKIEPEIPYETRLQNFNTLISKKQEQILSNQSANISYKTLAQDVTLSVTGPTVTGTTIKYIEFDVNIKSSNSASYLDNMPVWLTFNPVVFGSNIVAANTVTVTNGSSFNNSQYLPANQYISDQGANTIAFAVGTDYLLSNPTRVNITTTYKLLAHVKMKVVHCGNATVNLSNASTAINSAAYTLTSSASSSSFLTYTSLFYSGNIANNFPCSATIIDFNSPINGGLNEVLIIKGVGFGSSRGNGQVKFRNADKFGFPYLSKLDNLDYIDWNDTLIKLKFPSTIDTIGNLEANTPGSGNFKVITNNATDSTISGVNLSATTFSVYFSIYSTRPSAILGITTAQKLKANLYKSVQSTGGYVIRLDTSISNYPDRKGCVIKAIKKWVCTTTINITLGNDTTMQNFAAYDKICNLFYASPAVFSTAITVAETKVNPVVCTTGVATRYIYDFDIRVNKSKNFFYDTTGATLPIGKIDFYEVMLHEIGHGIGLMHVMDSAAVMYYRTLGNQTFTISGSSRRDLVSFTSDIDAGDIQLATSLNNITGSCGAQDMVQINSPSCSGGPIGIKELLQSNFNMIVYPNPSTDGDVNISFDALENSKPKLEIYNLLGEKVMDESITKNNVNNNHYITKINLNDLSNGIYILNVLINNNKASYKIVKQ